jgi:ubiquinone/menaquinone biosynthesis C-methylase UbiE
MQAIACEEQGGTTMTHPHEANPDQKAQWNGPSGCAWVEMQELMDEMLQPFADRLVEHVLRAKPTRVLDIGCGSGATTLLAAKRLGKDGACVGADISAPLLEVARHRAAQENLPNVEFIQADAQTHPFEPGRFDAVMSRFGVMFFDDPVAAFANIRRATRSGATLAFAAWRSPAENPFMTTASRAAAPLLPNLRAPDPTAPGQFAFADPERVRHILEASGWQGVDLQPLDIALTVAKQDLFAYITKLGPVGVALREADEDTRTRVMAAVQAAFVPFIEGDTARYNAACWFVSARS